MSKPSDPRTVRYRIGFPEPHTHLYTVETTVPLPTPRPSLELALPAWTPGSYKVRDFARHVQDVAASDATTGAPLPCAKIDKQTWRIPAEGRAAVRLQWRVYAFEATVRTAHLDETHAYWNGANLCPYVVGEVDRPCVIEVAADGPASWQIETALPPVPGEPRAFFARDYDILVDSPFDVGRFEVATFEVEGVPHRLVMDGAGNYDLPRLREDVERIVRAEVAMFGGKPPYERYVFFTLCVPEGQPAGGLEHLDSTVLMWPRFRFRPKEKYEDFLALVSHEFFHLWNVKRLRPRELGPFDYRGETYTKALWICEGITSYYDEVLLRRSGCVDADWLLKKTADHVQAVEDAPGLAHQTLEESSFDAWIKYYQKNEHSNNATISYYEKGQLVAWLLDLEIRARTGGHRSLDDVMRRLYAEHPETGPGFETARFEALASETAGADLAPFFAAYVRGTAPLDYDRHLAPLGLRLGKEPRAKDAVTKAGEPEERAWLGLKTRAEGPRTFVTEVLEGSPAWRAGVQAMDEVLALDGFRVTHDTLDARLHERKPGDRVELTLFRGDRLVAERPVLAGRSYSKVSLVRRPDATEAQRRLYEGWAGESWKA